MTISRRSFLKGSAATAALSMVGGNAIELIAAETAALANGPGNKWPGRVVVNFNKNAASNSTANETVIKKMVDDSILLLTGEKTVGAAWKAIFPSSLTANSKIAIKINILNAGNPAPHPFSVMAITEGLQQMDFNGTKFPAANITIYDMNNGNSMDSAGYTAARFPNINRVKDSAQNFNDGALNNRTYAKTLGNSNFLINVFSPRGHNVGSTFSIGFKSHFGTYSNAPGLHNNAPANLRDINCTGPVFNKTVLSICSGIFGMNEGNGPTGGRDDYSTYSKKMDSSSTNNNPTTIIMSTDPVSCDMQTIKMMRLNNGKPYTVNDMPPYLKASGGISGALTPTYNIGIIDESKMDVRKIINGQNITPVRNNGPKVFNNQAEIFAAQIKGQNISHIEYRVPLSFVNHNASIDIINLNGSISCSIPVHIKGIGNQFSWNEVDRNGKLVSPGMYIVKFHSGPLLLSTKLTIVR